jgi:hypothetical protein
MTAQVTTPDLHPLQAVAACVAALGEALDGLPEGSLSGQGYPVGGLIADVARSQARIAELKLRLIRVAEEQDEAAKDAATGTDAWLAALTGTSRSVMAGGLWLARMLAEHYPAVRTAFARGDLDESQARVIVHAAHTIPATVPAAARDQAVTDLVARAVAQHIAPARLRRVARRMLDTVSTDSADVHEHHLLRAEEHRARAETWLTLHDNGDGTWAGRFTIPDLHAHLLSTVLEHLSAPRRHSRTKTGAPVVDETMPCDLNWSERLGAAFTELIEHLPTDGLANHGRTGATVMIHLDHRHLLDGLASARLDSGTEITAGQARRLACGAGIIPAVFDTPTIPLDLGRATRLHTKNQRAALSAHHDTCATQGCQRPFAWTEIHHRKPWSQGGHTDLANALPLCGWHHQRAHDHTYDLHTLPTGEVHFRKRRQAGRERPGSTSSVLSR